MVLYNLPDPTLSNVPHEKKNLPETEVLRGKEVLNQILREFITLDIHRTSTNLRLCVCPSNLLNAPTQRQKRYTASTHFTVRLHGISLHAPVEAKQEFYEFFSNFGPF
jgi:hypothetical protein